MSEIEKVTQEQVATNTRVLEGSETNAIEATRVAINDMALHAKELAESGDYVALISGLLPLQQIMGDLRILESEVKRYIVDTMPDKMVTVEGVGTVERLAKITRRNWDSEELLRLIVRDALVDQETGEIPSSPMEAVDRVMTEIKAVVPFTGSTSWRVGELKKRGIDPDEWCEENRDGYSLKFTKSDRS